ncbi:MAG: rhodanese-like domain-containing protein [Methylophilaceae bacterium]
MKNYSDIEASELVNLITLPKVMLVDVRNADEVARGIIPGAIHIQLSMLPLHYERLTSANTVVFYCHSGIRSAHAADFAISKGLSNVHNLAGGIVAWDKAGYTLEQA